MNLIPWLAQQPSLAMSGCSARVRSLSPCVPVRISELDKMSKRLDACSHEIEVLRQELSAILRRGEDDALGAPLGTPPGTPTPVVAAAPPMGHVPGASTELDNDMVAEINAIGPPDAG